MFKVVKALADFATSSISSRSSERTVAEALQVAHQVDGEAYLGEIVQAPFSLPAIDQARLRNQTARRSRDGSVEQFKRSPTVRSDPLGRMCTWMGLIRTSRKPRDIVRIVNSLR